MTFIFASLFLLEVLVNRCLQPIGDHTAQNLNQLLSSMLILASCLIAQGPFFGNVILFFLDYISHSSLHKFTSL